MKEPLLYRIVRAPLGGIFKLIYRPQIIGKENIPAEGSIVLAGNHTGFFDCLLIGVSTKRCVHYMAKDELTKGILGPLFKGMGIIPVNRRTKDRQSLQTAMEYLQDNKVIGIFPAGTISRTDDVIMPFKFGAVKMAGETGTNIVPFVITGGYRPFRKGLKVVFYSAMQVGENLEEANNKLMDIVKTGIIKDKGESK